MINYRLKDGERQEALRKALPRFDEMLWRDCYQQMKNDEEYVFVSLPAPDDVGDFVSLWKVALRKSDIEIENPYDPNGWNDFPEVQPPEGVLMRVERDLQGCIRRECAIFEEGLWRYTEDGKAMRGGVEDYIFSFRDVTRFRPWE